MDGGSSKGGEAGEGCEDEWEQVGPKNKSTVTRQVTQSCCPETHPSSGCAVLKRTPCSDMLS